MYVNKNDYERIRDIGKRIAAREMRDAELRERKRRQKLDTTFTYVLIVVTIVCSVTMVWKGFFQ